MGEQPDLNGPLGIEGSGAESFFGNEKDGPMPPASNLHTLLEQFRTVERATSRQDRQTTLEVRHLEDRLEVRMRESEETERADAKELEHTRQESERQVRDAVNKLRKDLFLTEDARRKSEARAESEESGREEAERYVESLEDRMIELEIRHSEREQAAEREVRRTIMERDANYRLNKLHADERVKAMCSMAREAQDAMYRNMDHLDDTRHQLTVRAHAQEAPVPRPSMLHPSLTDALGKKMSTNVHKSFLHSSSQQMNEFAGNAADIE